MCHGGRSSGRQGGFEQNPNLQTLPASTSGTSRPVGCIRGLWNWAPGHGPGCTPVVPQGLGLRGRDSAARGWHPGGGGSVLLINLSLFPSSHWPERILPRPQGQGAPWQAHGVRTPADLLQPRVLPCLGSSTTVGPLPHGCLGWAAPNWELVKSWWRVSPEAGLLPCQLTPQSGAAVDLGKHRHLFHSINTIFPNITSKYRNLEDIEEKLSKHRSARRPAVLSALCGVYPWAPL